MINFKKELFRDIKPEWKEFFDQQYEKKYFRKLIENLFYEYTNFLCFPEVYDIFKPFKILLYNEIKVVIFGQDPYHNPNQADGIAFSCSGKKIPHSLRNIFKELKNDLNIEKNDGNLISWLNQGVFLYNSFLTVRKNKPNSHCKLGWKEFTIELLKFIESKKTNIIYLLLGQKAKDNISFINSKYIIELSHPSPFSFYKGFANSKPFSKINNILKANEQLEINW